MIKYVTRPLKKKDYNRVISLIKKTRKILTILGLIGILWANGPMQYLNAMDNQPIYTEQVVYNNDTLLPTYPSTTDIDFNSMDVEIESEIDEYRTLTSKTFQKKDGSLELAMYEEIIHYEQDGELLDIDNRLQYDSSLNVFENSQNKFKIKFPKHIDDNKQIKLEMDKYSIDWSILNINSSEITFENNDVNPSNIKALTNINQSILYSDINQGVNVEYIIKSTSIKENIILNEYSQNFDMTFEYKIKDLTLQEDETGNLVFVNELGEIIFSFNKLYMIDANNNVSYDVNIQYVHTSNKNYTITITPDDQWLQNAVYPVKIDPSLQCNTNPTEITYNDTYVYENNPTMNYKLDPFLKVWNAVHSQDFQSVFHFTIPTQLRTHRLTYAFYSIHSDDPIGDNDVIKLYKNTELIDIDDITWNNKPTIDTTYAVDYVRKNSTGKYTFDITSTVNDWLDDGIYNVPGFTIIQDNTSSEALNFHSENSDELYPTLTFGCVGEEGIKNYWTYNTQEVAEAGTGYVSDFTGDLYFARNDLQYSTDKQSFGLSMIYSINEASTNIGYGNGWKTNYSMTRTYDTEFDIHTTIDASGNQVYYHSTTCDDRVFDGSSSQFNCYLAEDGSKSILIHQVNQYGYVSYSILTIDQIEYNFGSDEYLDSIINTKTGLSINIVRDSSNKDKILQITDDSSNRIVFDYETSTKIHATLEIYDGTSYTTIQKVTYNYDGYLKMTTVYHYANYNQSALTPTAYITYEYNGYKLDKAKSDSGLTVEYQYDGSDKVLRIDTSKEGVTDYQLGYVTYNYDTKRTTITDHNGDYINYYFDDFGHTITVLDSNGVTQHFRYMNPLCINIGTEVQPNFVYYKDASLNYNFNHQLISQSSPQITTVNPVSNHSFEYDFNNDDTWIPEVTYNNSANMLYGITDVKSLYGEHSAFLQNTISQTSYLKQQLYLDASETYTFTGFVFAEVANTSGIQIVVNPNQPNEVIKSTEYYTQVDQWEQLETTFTLTSTDCPTGTCEVEVRLFNTSTTQVYFDNIQSALGYTDTRKNMIDNSSFENVVSGWYFNDTSSVQVINDMYNVSFIDEYTDVLGENHLIMNNTSASLLYASVGLHDLPYTTTSNYEYNIVVGSFAYVDESSPISQSFYDQDYKVFRIRVDFMKSITEAGEANYDNEIIDSAFINFDASASGLQYVLEEVSVPINTEFINIRYEYSGEGTVQFDNLQVYDRPTFYNYYYDEESGFKTMTTTPSGDTIFSQFTENNAMVSRSFSYDSDGEIHYYTDVDTDTSYLVSEIGMNNIKSTPTYNADGQITSITIGDTVSSFTRSTYYETFGNQYVSKETDEFNNSTTFLYDEITGLIERVQDASLNKTEFEYTVEGALYKVTQVDYCDETTGECAETTYIYQDDLLSKIVLTTGYDVSHNYYGYYYSLEYDELSRIQSIKVVNDKENTTSSDDFVQELMTYTYNTDGSFVTGQVNTQTYGNGDSILFNYNDKDQVESISYKENGESSYVETYSYEYDHKNRVSATHTHDAFGLIESSEYYTYNESNNIIMITDQDGNEIHYTYDSDGNLTELNFKFNGDEIITQYNHGEKFEFERNLIFEELTKAYISSNQHPLFEYGSVDIVSYDSNNSILSINQTSTATTSTTLGGILRVLGGSTYTLSFDVESIEDDAELILIQYCGDPTDNDNFTVKETLGTVNTTGEKSYTFNVRSDTKYITLVLHKNGIYQMDLTSLNLDFQGEERSTLYDNTSYTSAAGKIVTNDYSYESDALYRLKKVTTIVNFYSIEKNINYVGDTSRIESISYDLDNNLNYLTETYKYSYLYDNIGNIVKETYYESGIMKSEVHYEYDSLNQLIREDVRNYDVSVDAYTYTNFTRYFYYDLRGNIIETKKFAYGESDMVTVSAPSFFQKNYGSRDGYMNYNGNNDYQDIYELNVGETPSLSFTYYESLFNMPITLTTTYIDGDLDISTPGYYTQMYRAYNSKYDIRFNIIFKVGDPVAYATPEVHKLYLYDTLGWQDQLLSVNTVDSYNTDGSIATYTMSKSYTYDNSGNNQGNPLTISNFEFEGSMYTAEMEYTGRQLTSILLKDSNMTEKYHITYKYNDQGYRTSKTIDDLTDISSDGITTVEYKLSGDKVLYETDGTYAIIYTYDVDGTIISFSYNSNINDSSSEYNDYFYLRNIQGDIIKIYIVDDYGNKITLIEYQYDSWGNILDTLITDNSLFTNEAIEISEMNQYFYRGYRLDKETNLYYLNSRYYDAEVGRFINADGLLGEQGNILGHNMFAYCGNNPVMHTDSTGYLSDLVIKGIGIGITILLIAFTSIAVIPAILIGLAVIAFIDLGNEHYETRKLRQEIVDNAQRIEDEAVREVYIQEANAACDFRWQFAFVEFIPNLLSEPVDIVFFPFGIDTNPVNYMRGPVYNLYSSDYVWMIYKLKLISLMRRY